MKLLRHLTHLTHLTSTRTLWRAAAAAALLAPVLASAQVLNAAWDGEWVALEATQGKPADSLRIMRRAAQSQLVQAGQACPLAYDGLVDPAGLAQRIRALQDWQLSPQHWPAGTEPAQLIGLRREFDHALQMVGSLSGSRYRVTRIRSTGDDGCSDADDIFFVLHQGQRLLRLRFPSASLGVDLITFQKRSSP